MNETLSVVALAVASGAACLALGNAIVESRREARRRRGAATPPAALAPPRPVVLNTLGTAFILDAAGELTSVFTKTDGERLVEPAFQVFDRLPQKFGLSLDRVTGRIRVLEVAQDVLRDADEDRPLGAERRRDPGELGGEQGETLGDQGEPDGAEAQARDEHVRGDRLILIRHRDLCRLWEGLPHGV